MGGQRHGTGVGGIHVIQFRATGWGFSSLISFPLTFLTHWLASLTPATGRFTLSLAPENGFGVGGFNGWVG
jgi:hypothetical protein